jgi:hypothetical protein
MTIGGANLVARSRLKGNGDVVSAADLMLFAAPRAHAPQNKKSERGTAFAFGLLGTSAKAAWRVPGGSDAPGHLHRKHPVAWWAPATGTNVWRRALAMCLATDRDQAKIVLG